MINLEMIIVAATQYKAKSDDPAEMEKVKPETFQEDGYTWYMVGHNSSHTFALAVDDNGKVWRRSYAIEEDFEEGYEWSDYMKLLHSPNEEDNLKALQIRKYVEDKRISEVTGNVGYLGHW
jgi:hypothetical protein